MAAAGAVVAVEEPGRTGKTMLVLRVGMMDFRALDCQY